MENNEPIKAFEFDNENYRMRLEFFLRYHLCANAVYLKAFGMSMLENINDISFKVFCATLFEMRYKGINIIENNNGELVQTHYEYVIVSLNQFMDAFAAIQKQQLPLPLAVSKMEILIKEKAKELADEVEELINKNDRYAQQSNTNGQ